MRVAMVAGFLRPTAFRHFVIQVGRPKSPAGAARGLRGRGRHPSQGDVQGRCLREVLGKLSSSR